MAKAVGADQVEQRWNDPCVASPFQPDRAISQVDPLDHPDQAAHLAVPADPEPDRPCRPPAHRWPDHGLGAALGPPRRHVDHDRREDRPGAHPSRPGLQRWAGARRPRFELRPRPASRLVSQPQGPPTWLGDRGSHQPRRRSARGDGPAAGPVHRASRGAVPGVPGVPGPITPSTDPGDPPRSGNRAARRPRGNTGSPVTMSTGSGKDRVRVRWRGRSMARAQRDDVFVREDGSSGLGVVEGCWSEPVGEGGRNRVAGGRCPRHRPVVRLVGG